jgi:hypothetical protein
MSRLAVFTLTLVLAVAAACSEPLASKVPIVPDPVTEARLVLSDSTAAVGATFAVVAQVTLPEQEVAGSFTARIRYDTTALRFEDEIAIADGTMRATNPTPGVVRFAGAAERGVVQGRLASFRFRVLRADGARTLQLFVDELHSVTRANAASALRVSP